MSDYKIEPVDSGAVVKEFFNKYFNEPITYNANTVDSVVGFFKRRGFDDTSATGVATVLLEQAKIDGVNVYTLLDTLKGVEDIQISAIVAQVLNYNRQKSSSLGFTSDKIVREESRNIVV